MDPLFTSIIFWLLLYTVVGAILTPRRMRWQQGTTYILGALIHAGIGLVSSLIGGSKDKKSAQQNSKPVWQSQPKPTDPKYWDFVNELYNQGMSPNWSTSQGSSSTRSVQDTNRLVSPETLEGFGGMKGVLTRNAMNDLLAGGKVPGEQAGMIRDSNRAFRSAATMLGDRGGDGVSAEDPAMSMLAGSRANTLAGIPTQVAQAEAQRKAQAQAQGSSILGQFGTGQRTVGQDIMNSTTNSFNRSEQKGTPSDLATQLMLWGKGGSGPNDMWYVPGQQAPSTASQFGNTLLNMYGQGAFDFLNTKKKPGVGNFSMDGIGGRYGSSNGPYNE